MPDHASAPARVTFADMGGGISDFEEPYFNEVRPTADLGGGISDFEEPYFNPVRLHAPIN